MEISWKWLNICLGLLFFQLCNGFPINLEDSVADQHTQLLTGLVAVLLTVCSVVLLAGCLCCQRRNGFKEFRDSPVVASAASNLDHGHVNPIANGEFTIFTPLSSTPYNNNVFLANERIITRTAEDFIYEDFDVRSWFNESEKDFPRIKLKYIKELGKGWFGKVVEGAAKEVPPNVEAWTPVVVRILEATASRKERVLFLNDAAIYRCGNHANILSLIGRCLDTVPLLLLQEYCPQGDLKNHLRSKKENVEQLFCTDYPLLWCCQLTSALKHLHSNGVTHPDLATRNCQLTIDLTLKVGDYGLAESKYPEDYYQGSPRVPVRWSAPESLTCTLTTIQPKKVTTESNIWSLGVTMWEICECGEQPYPSLSDDEVVSQVLGPPNVRLSRPRFSILYTDYLYRLMELCWTNAESRPTVSQIDLMLSDLWQVYKNTKNSGFSADDFDKRWESFKPNSFLKIELTESTEMEEPGTNITKPLSPSLNNLHGSLDNLLDPGDQLELWLENVTKNDDLSLAKSSSNVVLSLDDPLVSEMSSSESSDRTSPRQKKSKLKSRIDFDLNTKFRDSNIKHPYNLSDSALFSQRTSSESETEDENWRKKVERGAYTEKVRLKSRSVADLMVLTHVDYSESESETPLPSLDYRVNYKNVRYAPKNNLENVSLTYGSEGNLLSVHDTFQEELKKLKEERRDSLLFVPDNHSQTSFNKLDNNNRNFPGEEVTLSDSTLNDANVIESTNKRLMHELNHMAEIQPANQVFNVFSVTIDKFKPIHVNSCKLNDIINFSDIEACSASERGDKSEESNIQYEESLFLANGSGGHELDFCDTSEKHISDFVTETYPLVLKENLNPLSKDIDSCSGEICQTDVQQNSEEKSSINTNIDDLVAEVKSYKEVVDAVNPLFNANNKGLEIEASIRNVDSNIESSVTTVIEDNNQNATDLRPSDEHLEDILQSETNFANTNPENGENTSISEQLQTSPERLTDKDVREVLVQPKENFEVPKLSEIILQNSTVNSQDLIKNIDPTTDLKSLKTLHVDILMQDISGSSENLFEEVNGSQKLEPSEERTVNGSNMNLIPSDEHLEDILQPETNLANTNQENGENASISEHLQTPPERLTDKDVSEILVQPKENFEVPKLSEIILQNSVVNSKDLIKNMDSTTDLKSLKTLHVDILIQDISSSTENLFEEISGTRKLELSEERTVNDSNMNNVPKLSDIVEGFIREEVSNETLLNTERQQRPNIKITESNSVDDELHDVCENPANIKSKDDLNVIVCENPASVGDSNLLQSNENQNLICEAKNMVLIPKLSEIIKNKLSTNCLYNDEDNIRETPNIDKSLSESKFKINTESSFGNVQILDVSEINTHVCVPKLSEIIKSKNVSNETANLTNSSHINSQEEKICQLQSKSAVNIPQTSESEICEPKVDAHNIQLHAKPIEKSPYDVHEKLQNNKNTTMTTDLNESSNNTPVQVPELSDIKTQIPVCNENNNFMEGNQFNSEVLSETYHLGPKHDSNVESGIYETKISSGHEDLGERNCLDTIKISNYEQYQHSETKDTFDEDQIIQDDVNESDDEVTNSVYGSDETFEIEITLADINNALESEPEYKVENDTVPKEMEEQNVNNIIGNLFLDIKEISEESHGSERSKDNNDLHEEDKFQRPNETEKDRLIERNAISDTVDLNEIVITCVNDVPKESYCSNKELQDKLQSNDVTNINETVLVDVNESLKEKEVVENLNENSYEPHEKMQNKDIVDLNDVILMDFNHTSETVNNFHVSSQQECEDTVSNKDIPSYFENYKNNFESINSDVESERREQDKPNEKYIFKSQNTMEAEHEQNRECNHNLADKTFNVSNKKLSTNLSPDFSIFTSTPATHKLNNYIPSKDKYSNVNLFGDCEEKDNAENLDFYSGLIPLDSSKELNYSLETWDSFLGKTLDAQKDIPNDHLFDSFSSEPHSLLFVESGNDLVLPHENLEIKNRQFSDQIPPSKEDNVVNNSNINNGTFVMEAKNDNNTFVIEDNGLSDKTFVLNKTETVEPESEDMGDNSALGNGGGWFLHPQTNNKEPSGTIEVRENTGSYVGFGIDDEIMAAIRNELLNKLPHAQVAPTEKVSEVEEWDSNEKNEVFLKYNIYNPPLSPILEESFIEESDSITPKQESDNEDSEWSEPDMPETLPPEPESQSAHTYDSQQKGPHHRHTPSQDSCCSNDTLFNLEELICAEKENDLLKNEMEPAFFSELERDGSDTVILEEKCVNLDNISYTQIPDNINGMDIKSETIDNGINLNNTIVVKNVKEIGDIVCEEFKVKITDDQSSELMESKNFEDTNYISEFITREIEHNLTQFCKLNEGTNSEPNSSQEDCPLAFKKTQIAPLPSPEDNPWKQLPASLLSYDKVISQNNTLLLPVTESNNFVPEFEDLPKDKDVMESQYKNAIKFNEDAVTGEDINDPHYENYNVEENQHVYENTKQQQDYENLKEKDPVYENVIDDPPVYENTKDTQPLYQNCNEPSDIYNEVDYVNIVNLENSRNNQGYISDKKDYVSVDESKVNNETSRDEDIYGMLTDIKFNGPSENHLISTSFSESNDINDEQDWDSGSDTRSSSSGEFIWKEGEHEESLKALRAAPQDVLEDVKPMEGIAEESTDESDVSSTTSDEEGEAPEFVPSAWDKFATPTKSALRSPEKTLEKSEKNKSKGVWFKKQKYHCVYEYPREPESPVLQSQDLWKPQLDYSSFTDWEFDADTYFPTTTVDDNDIFPTAYNYQPKSISSRNLYQLTSISDFVPSNAGLEDEFYVSSSARPFDIVGNLSSQFFPGSANWTGENATPDSGMEDGTLGSSTEISEGSGNIEKMNSSSVQSLKKLASEAVKRSRQMSIKNTDALGGLRHTRNKLKLDLPPSPSAFTSTKMFLVEPTLEPVIREKPTFTTFGKSRFSVQHVDTPPEESKNKNVSFEALPYKPLREEPPKEVCFQDIDHENKIIQEKHILRDKFECVKGHNDFVRGEASLLDSADEDSGIESSTLERKLSSEGLLQ